ncbi:MAG: hypothetical protein ACR2KO_07400 [Geodermatophilaceae bacterium]
MAGGMAPRRSGLSLAERLAGAGVRGAAGSPPVPTRRAAGQPSNTAHSRAVTSAPTHCW